MLYKTGYNQSCDWWSVGVILYEMLVGQPPFFAPTPEETQNKVIDSSDLTEILICSFENQTKTKFSQVINWQSYLHIPVEAQLSDEATDLILKLCTSAENRLGRRGADSIKAHPFFKNFNFNDLRKQEAPYKPKFKHALDTSNFDPVEQERQTSEVSYAMNHYENNDYMTPLEDQQCPNQRRRRDKKIPEYAFFDFTFRRFDEGNPMQLPFCPIIKQDGTLKFSSLKNYRLTDEYQTGEENDERSGADSPQNEQPERRAEPTDTEKKEAAVYV